MDTFTIASCVVAFLAIAAAIGAPIWLKARQSRREKFRTIGEDWLTELNRVATDPNCNITGSPFVHTKCYPREKRCSVGWTVCYPLRKHDPDQDLVSEVDMIIHVYSLAPSKQEAVDTAFIDLVLPGQPWWDSQRRRSTFNKLAQLIAYGNLRERKISFAPAFGDTLVPAKQ